MKQSITNTFILSLFIILIIMIVIRFDHRETTIPSVIGDTSTMCKKGETGLER